MAIQLYKAAFTATSPNDAYLSSYPSSNLPSSQSAFTLMGWMQSASATWSGGATATASILGMYNGTNDAATVPTTALQIGCDTANAISAWTWGGTNLITTTGFTPPNNTWFHVAYTCTAGTTQTHSLYINGVLNNTASNATQIAGTFTQVYINGFPQTVASAETYTETSLTQQDDVWIFNRALSANEILTIYNSFGMRDGIVYGLLARYNFNELSSGSNVASVRDFSGNNNTLTMYNRGGTTPIYLQDWSNEDTRPPL